ncbi:succinate dehydrogenase, cytochrome b556 subunit [Faucicola boevrei]|uniref:succinate dehydrogenase, cytochrome b556 subunit n=1 Tax=Faucicola boevrei TaxID=346665 RepID=UPI0009FC6592|nr:succinate dehydrogenase, cytochrome b556 subunit [Moraxella boevrei]
MPAVKSNRRPVVLPLSHVIEVNSKNPVAMASITHRVSGIVLFLLVPVVLWIFQTSLATPEGFEQIFSNVLVKLLAWVFVAALGYHFVMGVKHLLADMGLNEELKSGRTATIIGFVLAAIWVVGSFVWVMF